MIPSRSLPNKSYIPNPSPQQPHKISPTLHSLPNPPEPLHAQPQRPHNPSKTPNFGPYMTHTHTQLSLLPEFSSQSTDHPQNPSNTPLPIFIQCSILPGDFCIIPINNVAYLQQQEQRTSVHGHRRPHGNMYPHYPSYQHNNANSPVPHDLSLLYHILSDTAPYDNLTYARDENGDYLDLIYSTTTNSIQHQSDRNHQDGKDHNNLYPDDPHQPFISITRLSSDEQKMSLITPIQTLHRIQEKIPHLVDASVNIPILHEETYIGIEIIEGSSALNLTGFISTLTKPLVEQLGLYSCAYISTYNTDIILVPYKYARLAFEYIIVGVSNLIEILVQEEMEKSCVKGINGGGIQDAMSVHSDNINTHYKLNSNTNNVNNDQHHQNVSNISPMSPTILSTAYTIAPTSITTMMNGGVNTINNTPLNQQTTQKSLEPQQIPDFCMNRVISVNNTQQLLLSSIPREWLVHIIHPTIKLLSSPILYNEIPSHALIESFYTQILSPQVLDDKKHPSEMDSSVPINILLPQLTNLHQAKTSNTTANTLNQFPPSSLFSIIISKENITIYSDCYILSYYLLHLYPNIYMAHHMSTDPCIDRNTPGILPGPDHMPKNRNILIHTTPWLYYQVLEGTNRYNTYLESLVHPISALLASAKISIIYLSTHAGDYLLTQTNDQQRTIDTLRLGKFIVEDDE